MIEAGDNRPMLEGLRVVDMTSVVFGPYCTQILADFGAEVIKVEAPGGDVFRHAARPARTPGMAPGYIALNRGKQSLLLDLKQDADRRILSDLLCDADIFIHNVRAEAIARLGFDYDTVRELAPDIIYAHCVGFGSGGPYAGLQAYDDVIQAASGTATLLPRADGDARPRYLPSLIADKVAGLHAAYAVMGAVIHRLRTGAGQHVEIPMFEAFSSFMLKEHLGGNTFDPPVGDACYARQVDPHRQPFPTRDGHVSIVPYRLDHFTKVVALMGDEAFATQERFATVEGLVAGQPDLYTRIAELSTRFTTGELVELMHANAIPAMPVRDMADMASEPHLHASGFFLRREHPSEGAMVEMREPSRFSGWDAPDPAPAPRLGEHDSTYR
ncbi:MAG: CoA transferase [Pseudomonadota bacterium]|nr:CoA transferase [Pseudomonadota bacterium]